MSKVFWTYVGALVVVAFVDAASGQAFGAMWAVALAFLCGGMANAMEVGR